MSDICQRLFSVCQRLALPGALSPAPVQRLRRSLSARPRLIGSYFVFLSCSDFFALCSLCCSLLSVLLATTTRQAVLARCKGSEVKAVPLSKEHRLTLLQERARVLKAGGAVADGRVNGLLAGKPKFAAADMISFFCFKSRSCFWAALSHSSACLSIGCAAA